MKKQSVIALLSILCLLVGLPVRAQLQDPRHNLAIGINGGVNLSSVSFEPSIKQKTFITPSVGVTVRYISERYLFNNSPAVILIIPISSSIKTPHQSTSSNILQLQFELNMFHLYSLNYLPLFLYKTQNCNLNYSSIKLFLNKVLHLHFFAN